MKINKEMIYKARNADLADFLLRTDPEHYIRQGNSVRLYDPDEPRRNERIKRISVKMGASWYHDFKTGESGNAVEYLKNYMGYGYYDAVRALAGENVPYKQAQNPEIYAKQQEEKKKLPVEFPEKAENGKRVFGYLCGRGIPAETIKSLMQLGILYQSKDKANCVFVNGKRDFAEVRGTYTFGNPFHQVIRNQPDKYWSFAIGHPKKAYICESSIDAISLYVLKQKEGTHDNALYVGIAGVENQQSIDLIKKCIPAVIAVDNDDAGQKCRDRNPDCEYLIPKNKDWNEDLQKSREPSLDEVIELDDNLQKHTSERQSENVRDDEAR